MVVADPLFTIDGVRIEELATAAGLPALYPNRSFIDAGGLMADAVLAGSGARLAAGYVARILRGAKPADLPMSAPNEFEFVGNLKAAQAIGFTFPPSFLDKATDVIH